MENTVRELSAITAAFKDHVLTLQDLADQVAHLGGRIAKIGSKFGIHNQDSDELDKRAPGFNAVTGSFPNIIPFPKTYQAVSKRQELSAFRSERSETPLFFASPGKSLPETIPDFRPVLQRDGLILLAWDKRKTDEGFRFTAYWVTSAGTPRFYASGPHSSEDFASARPARKSYAAEDGIEFYGQEAPLYLVHVAPELMKSNPRHKELRVNHINALKHQGSTVDFDYRYLLKNEKNLSFPR